MKDTPFEKVPLTADEKNLLLTVYRTRRRFFLSVYAFLIALGIVTSFKVLDYRGRYGAIHHWEENDDAKIVSRSSMLIINLVFIESILIISGVYFYATAVARFRKDAESGVKYKIPYTIIRKEYFPLTNQFFGGFDDPQYLHHEIDEETFNKCVEGENMFIYRAVKTKFVFEDDGRFSIL